MPTEQIVPLLGPVIRGYALDRTPGERFGDFVIRAGYAMPTNTPLMSGLQARTRVRYESFFADCFSAMITFATHVGCCFCRRAQTALPESMANSLQKQPEREARVTLVMHDNDFGIPLLESIK